MSDTHASNMSSPVGLDRPGLAALDVSTWRAVAPLSVVIFLSMLPVTMLVPVLKEIVAERFAASTFWVHSFMSVNMVGALLAAPIGGLLADRLGRRKPILLAAIIADGVLFWLMGVVDTLPALFVVRFLEGMAHILVITSIMAVASDWTDPAKRGRAMGLLGAGLMFGTTIGSPLGGVIGRMAPELVLPIGSMLCMIIAILVIVVVYDRCTKSTAVSLTGMATLLRSSRGLLVAYTYSFIDRFCVGVIVSTFMLYISDVLALAPAQRGLMIACFMLPFSALCYPVGRLSDRLGRVWPLALGSIGFGFALASYGWISAAALPFVMLASGLLAAVMFAPNLAMCADLAPQDQRATAFAGFNMAGSLGFLCGPLFGGALSAWLAPALGQADAYRTVLASAGAMEVLCALLTLPSLLKLRKSGKLR